MRKVSRKIVLLKKQHAEKRNRRSRRVAAMSTLERRAKHTVFANAKTVDARYLELVKNTKTMNTKQAENLSSLRQDKYSKRKTARRGNER
jgi:hypothetical protein